MQNMTHPLSGLTTSDYLLVLEPHEALRSTIMEVKQSFADNYECPAALYSKPQYTLLRFMPFHMLVQQNRTEFQ